VSFIGRTHGIIDGKVYPTIDYLENPGKLIENVRDNLFSPLSLGMECKERSIHYTYLGTGCIFNYANVEEAVETGGRNEYKFNENDVPNFFGSSYSIVKGFNASIKRQCIKFTDSNADCCRRKSS
jgi:3,5-epimerase/4-reductase